jgi:hypothetical protein
VQSIDKAHKRKADERGLKGVLEMIMAGMFLTRFDVEENGLRGFKAVLV